MDFIENIVVRIVSWYFLKKWKSATDKGKVFAALLVDLPKAFSNVNDKLI